MKTFVSILVVLSALLFIQPVQAQGQGKGKEKQEQRTKEKEKKDPASELEKPERADQKPALPPGQNKDKSQRPEKTERERPEAKEPRGDRDDDDVYERPDRDDDDFYEKPEREAGQKNGNAYGRNKGGLEGRAFGQARAEAARAQNDVRRNEARLELDRAENIEVIAREKIGRAKRALEEAKIAGTLSEEELARRAGAIRKAEERLKEVETAARKTREASTGGN